MNAEQTDEKVRNVMIYRNKTNEKTQERTFVTQYIETTLFPKRWKSRQRERWHSNKHLRMMNDHPLGNIVKEQVEHELH